MAPRKVYSGRSALPLSTLAGWAGISSGPQGVAAERPGAAAGRQLPGVAAAGPAGPPARAVGEPGLPPAAEASVSRAPADAAAATPAWPPALAEARLADSWA